MIDFALLGKKYQITFPPIHWLNMFSNLKLVRRGSWQLDAGIFECGVNETGTVEAIPIQASILIGASQEFCSGLNDQIPPFIT